MTECYVVYEFKQPASQRLTDEEWKEMLTKGEELEKAGLDK